MTGRHGSLSGRVLVSLISFATAIAGLAGSASPASAGAFPGPNGRIAFESIPPDGPGQILTVRPDGSGIRQITHVHTGFGAFDPNWSADGRWLVYDIDNGQASHIFIKKADGTDRRRLTNDKYGCHVYPAFSPSGRRIVFATWPGTYPDCFGNSPDLYVMRVDGTGLRNLTDTPGLREVAPEWSPDGKWIAYTAHTDNNFDHQIYVIRADGSGRRRITRSAIPSLFPDWSPDGRWITYMGYDNHFRIYAVHPDGTGRKALTNAPALLDDLFPAFSPDGRQISFASDRLRDEDFDLFVMNADGTGIHRIVADPGYTFIGQSDWGTFQGSSGSTVTSGAGQDVSTPAGQAGRMTLAALLKLMLRRP